MLSEIEDKLRKNHPGKTWDMDEQDAFYVLFEVELED